MNRAIPMNNILESLLKPLVGDKRSEKYVFPSTKGTQIRERRILDICKSIAIKANIASRAYLHKFRSTYATALIHRGVPIQNIKELLGHWSVIETEIYAHNKSDHLHPDVSKLDSLLL
ncbi:MAG: site-specific integrase [Bacteroidetes bacterium]|nr:site-specific integrase [Bacteroidota bacterium]